MKKNLIICATLCLFSFVAQASKMSDSVRAFYVAVDAGDFEKAGTYLSDNLKATLPFAPQGLDKLGYKNLGMSMKLAFPDMQHKILEISEANKTVAFQAIFSGTNMGSLMGNPPTGNRVETPFLGYFKFNDQGKISEVNLQFDASSFNTQLMKGIDPGAPAEKTIRAMLAAADEGNGDKFMGFWADNGKNYFAGKLTSQEEMKMRIPAFKTAFPDIKRTLDEVVVNGRTVTVRGWVTGTNKGSFMGNEPTGNIIKVHWLGFYKMNEAGKVESGWVEFDGEALKNQVKGASMGMK